MTLTGSPACGGGSSVIDVVPDDRGDDAGPVGKRKPHVVRAGPGATDLALADEQHLIDGASVLKVANIAGRDCIADELHVRRVVGRQAS